MCRLPQLASLKESHHAHLIQVMPQIGIQGLVHLKG
jgi:hypothetical protein